MIDLILFVPLLFLIIAFIFSMLGMGGAQFYIPILWWMGMDFKTEAIPLGLLLNIVSTSSATFTYSKSKLIDWKITIPFSIAIAITAPLGAMYSIGLKSDVIVILFAIFSIGAALLVLSNLQITDAMLSKKQKSILGVVSGGILGFFAGLIGRGGGSFIVPILLIFGLSSQAAVASSSFIVTISALSSFISHLATSASPNWLIWFLSTFAVLIGSQAGSRYMVSKIDPKRLKKIFSAVLLIISFIMILQIILF